MNEITKEIELNMNFSLYNYLGEDIKLFNQKAFEDSFIFGGFIRDSITGDKINDLDLACPRKDYILIENILIKLNEHEFIKNHGAVAFTIPMDGISQKTIEYILKMEENNERI